jgi:hypothetical protein
MKSSITRMKDYPIEGPMNGAQRWHAMIEDSNGIRDKILNSKEQAEEWLATNIKEH